MRLDSFLTAATFATGILSTTDSASAQLYRRIKDVAFLGATSIPTGTMFQGTEVGGLSGIAYDGNRSRYYAISDDRSQLAPARFYTLGLTVDPSTQSIQVQLQDVTTLTVNGVPYPNAGIDPEGIALYRDGTLFISSEGDANALLDPFVNRFRSDGTLRSMLPVPQDYLPTASQTSGIRNNLAFESLTLSPNDLWLTTATENALFQDGPAASLTAGSPCRILQYVTLFGGTPVREHVYLTEPIPDAPIPANQFATNGLVELLATDNTGTMLALERAFAVGVGNNVRLYEIRLPLLPWGGQNPLHKREVFDLNTLNLTLDNLEGMTLGPRLPDGRSLLIVVSDNNFSATQETQFLAFAVRFRGL
ncbi:MAG: esterase-like activity of phytase family protein [Planctomycetes bacterium]|nr:esterase-like activity of phytase family protein [Planctomycetota bacterium]